MIPFVLSLPWGLFAQTPLDGRPVRHALRPGDAVELDGRHGAALAVAAGTGLKLSGRRWSTQPLGDAFPWDGAPMQLHALPGAALSSERRVRIDLHRSGQPPLDCELLLQAALLRPRGGAADTPAALAMLEFLHQTLGRLREVEAADADADADAGWREDPTAWDRLQRAWPERQAQAEEARHALIVEHAGRLPALVEATAGHPRRVLKRTRQQMPIDRIQELDTACLEWMIRRPGLSVAEKAGPRQRLLGVAREENLDTLENRVLKDFLRLSIEEAGLWQHANQRFGLSERARRVGRYQALCRNCHRELRAAGISDPVAPVLPNFVLQHDARYRVIWRAYRELLSAEQREDDLWRWQGRLWADFVRLAVVIGLGRIADPQVRLQAPLRLRREQARGRWSDTLARLAVFLLTLRGRPLVAEVLDPGLPQPAAQPAGLAAVAPWQHALGCTAVIVLRDGRDGRQRSLCVWAAHGVTDVPLSLETLAASADEALDQAMRREALHGDDRIRARGLVIRSKHDAAPEFATQAGRVYGLTLSADPARIREAFAEFALTLQDSLERLFA